MSAMSLHPLYHPFFNDNLKFVYAFSVFSQNLIEIKKKQ